MHDSGGLLVHDALELDADIEAAFHNEQVLAATITQLVTFNHWKTPRIGTNVPALLRLLHPRGFELAHRVLQELNYLVAHPRLLRRDLYLYPPTPKQLFVVCIYCLFQLCILG